MSKIWPFITSVIFNHRVNLITPEGASLIPSPRKCIIANQKIAVIRLKLLPLVNENILWNCPKLFLTFQSDISGRTRLPEKRDHLYTGQVSWNSNHWFLSYHVYNKLRMRPMQRRWGGTRPKSYIPRCTWGFNKLAIYIIILNFKLNLVVG